MNVNSHTDTGEKASLWLDTSARETSIALVRGHQILIQRISETNALDFLFSALGNCLKSKDLAFEELGDIYYCEGPGSSLGLRIGAMALKTWKTLRPEMPLYACRSLPLHAILLAEDVETPDSFSLVGQWKKGLWFHWEHQKDSTVAGVIDTLQRHGAMDYTIVVNAGASTPAPLQYIAPYAGTAMAEYFMNQGKEGKFPKHALCVYDDLSKQATAYRQLSLLLRRPPGREAYPGDVFYLHSRLLERSTKLSDENGGGSLTALPIIETQEGDVSAYIPTNVISITDGQIYLQPELFASGVRPAVNVGISVSRVGGNAQIKAMKEVAGSLRLDLAAFRELEAFAQLGTELDAASQLQLDRGARMVELLKQGQYEPYNVIDQCISMFAGTRGFLDDVDLNLVHAFERGLLDYFKTTAKALRGELAQKASFKEIGDQVSEAIKDYKTSFEASQV